MLNCQTHEQLHKTDAYNYKAVAHTSCKISLWCRKLSKYTCSLFWLSSLPSDLCVIQQAFYKRGITAYLRCQGARPGLPQHSGCSCPDQVNALAVMPCLLPHVSAALQWVPPILLNSWGFPASLEESDCLLGTTDPPASSHRRCRACSVEKMAVSSDQVDLKY